ncbi:MAG TPA: MFS transporter [Bryobacteraceae bacterium]|jgi:MFS family permease
MKRSYYPWLLVALLWIVIAVNYLDRQLIYSVFPLIKADMRLSDVELGLVSAAFIWVYGIVSPVAGWIGDRWGRTRVIILSLAIWSLVTWLTGHVHTFGSLLSVRGVMGISEACYLPAALALITDVHSGKSVSRATGIHQSGIYVGVVLGGVGGGWLGEHYGWRFAFTLLGVFGVSYAIVLVPILRRNSGSEERESKAALGFFPSVRELMLIRSFTFIALAFSAFAIANWAVYTWLPVYFYEKFSASLASAGFSATFYLQFASVVGVVAGGWIADRWAVRQPRARVLVQAIGTIAASPCLFLAGFTSSEIAAVLMLILFGLGKGLYDANTMPVLAQIARSDLRATGYGILNCAGGLAGGAAAAGAGWLKSVMGLGVVFELTGVILLGAVLVLLKIQMPVHSQTSVPSKVSNRI